MLSIHHLIWDAWNVSHISRHKITPDEVEQVCNDQPMTNATYAGRIRVVGLTKVGKILTVILAKKGENVYYPITARPASRKEQRIYQKQKGGAM